MVEGSEALERRIAEAERETQRARSEVAAVRSEISHLTATVDGIAKSVQGFSSEMRTAISDIGKDFHNRLEISTKEIYERIEDRSTSLAAKLQFPWQPFLAAVAIFTVVTGGILSFTLDVYSREIGKNSATLEKFDGKLQREMRLLDDILQREMKLINIATTERIDGVKERVTQIEKDQRDQYPRIYGSSDGTDRRLMSIEERLNSLNGIDWQAATRTRRK